MSWKSRIAEPVYGVRRWVRSGFGSATHSQSDPGPGGPILIATALDNGFSSYYPEILRAEGLNCFTVADVGKLSGSLLDAHELVITGEVPLGADGAEMLTSWVERGGNVIAMRPGAALAGTAGLNGPNSTLSEGYLRVDTEAPPGAGINRRCLQYHGPADLYRLSGARSVATLYQDSETSTPHPAVTLHEVGREMGRVAVFAFDLARSIVLTRQGNPAWAGRHTDGSGPARTADLFRSSGSGERPWVDPERVAIPQADELQRLLVNLVLHMTRSGKPLPRFWYLPRRAKAAIVLTGDDHGKGDVAARFDRHRAADPGGGSSARWEGVRSTCYLSPRTPLPAARAAAYTAEGFEVAPHLTTGCADWTPARLEFLYARQLRAWRARYPELPPPSTVRTHCAAWSDWATQPHVEAAHGIRLDTNYYYHPADWVADRPGLFTGSGLPMRFANLDGTVIDAYQAATQMTDESGQTYPATVETLLDSALGPEGFYGAFAANVHTDPSADPRISDWIVGAALERGVPVASARQMLQWLDGRNGSWFRIHSWGAGRLVFTIHVHSKAEGLLAAMLPVEGGGGRLKAVERERMPVPHSAEVIKGIGYAFFPASSGNYTAIYGEEHDR